MPKKGYKQTGEHKRKISESHIGFLGKHHTEETKGKIAKARQRRFGGNNNPNWKGGKRKYGAGYILVYSPVHPRPSYAHYVLEHRLVMEKHLGRNLLPTEIVHHINEIRDDNRIENLMLCGGNKEHSDLHNK